jgi:hypothetical protein
MRRLSFAAIAVGTGLALQGCGQAETPGVSAPPPLVPSGVDAAEVSGTYVVRGVTVQAQTGQQREIEGTLQLSVDGNRYDVSFDLATVAPDGGEPVPVQVRGTGRGLVVGGIFTGTAEEWMSLAIPMEESAGVALPEQAGREIVSTSQGSFDADGSFHVLLQNELRRGEGYAPSITVLAGRRRPAPAD